MLLGHRSSLESIGTLSLMYLLLLIIPFVFCVFCLGVHNDAAQVARQLIIRLRLIGGTSSAAFKGIGTHRAILFASIRRSLFLFILIKTRTMVIFFGSLFSRAEYGAPVNKKSIVVLNLGTTFFRLRRQRVNKLVQKDNYNSEQNQGRDSYR